jgi:uncharacterized RDD family membrane protein YckC
LRTIEINTTQNVTIEYELAPFYARLLAYLLDLVIIMTGLFILSLIGRGILSGSAGQYYAYLVLLPVFLLYAFMSELLMNGQSVGKLALGIRVVKLNGKQATISDYIIRWMFRLLDIYMSVGAVASILISSTDKSQRIGDIIAGTVLINVRPSRSQRLKDLLNIHSIANYRPRYPEVKYLQEEDMLLVKSVLERYRIYKNEAHEIAQEELVNRIMHLLHIQKLQQEKPDFLRTVLNDYIVLTR